MSTNLNAFLAQGLADAVGRPFEFGSPSPKIVQKYMDGDEPLHISDDTQMALFGLHGMTLGLRLGEPLHQVKLAYLDWLRTQQAQYLANQGGLLNERKLWRREAPGMTCLASLRAIAQGQPLPRRGNGCGTVMRLLPFACYGKSSGDWDCARKLAEATSLLTHTGTQIVPATRLYMDVAHDLATTGKSAKVTMHAKMVPTIDSYGQGWDAESCMAMALWALGHAKTFRQLLVHAIAHGGDSDSVAAVAGGLWGLAGRDVPEGLAARLDEQDVIARAVAAFEKELVHA